MALPPPTGLFNSGNTCFLSSAIQIVWRPFVDEFVRRAIAAPQVSNAAANNTESCKNGSATPKKQIKEGDPTSCGSSPSIKGKKIKPMPKVDVGDSLGSIWNCMAHDQSFPVLPLVDKKCNLKHICEESGISFFDVVTQADKVLTEATHFPRVLTLLRNIFLTTLSPSKAERCARPLLVDLKRILSESDPGFNNGQQHDSHELCLSLLAAIHNELNTGRGGKGGYKLIADKRKTESDEDVARRWMKASREHDDSLVTNLYWFNTQTSTKCPSCNHRNLNFDVLPEMNIDLIDSKDTRIPACTSEEEIQCIQGKKPQLKRAPMQAPASPVDNSRALSFEALLNKHLNSCEEVEDYKCEKCHHKVTIKKETSVVSYPQYWLIHLKRFDYDGGKNRTLVVLPMRSSSTSQGIVVTVPPRPLTTSLSGGDTMSNASSSTASPIISDSEDNSSPTRRFHTGTLMVSEYQVVGVVNHLGGGLNYGHYTSYVGASDMLYPHDGHDFQWYYCEDEYVEPCVASRVAMEVQSGAYLVLLRAVVPPIEEKSHL